MYGIAGGACARRRRTHEGTRHGHSFQGSTEYRPNAPNLYTTSIQPVLLLLPLRRERRLPGGRPERLPQLHRPLLPVHLQVRMPIKQSRSRCRSVKRSARDDSRAVPQRVGPGGAVVPKRVTECGQLGVSRAWADGLWVGVIGHQSCCSVQPLPCSIHPRALTSPAPLLQRTGRHAAAVHLLGGALLWPLRPARSSMSCPCVFK